MLLPDGAVLIFTRHTISAGLIVSVPVCSVIYVYLSEKVRAGLKKRRGKAALCDPEVEAALAIETTANEQDTVKE